MPNQLDAPLAVLGGLYREHYNAGTAADVLAYIDWILGTADALQPSFPEYAEPDDFRRVVEANLNAIIGFLGARVLPGGKQLEVVPFSAGPTPVGPTGGRPRREGTIRVALDGLHIADIEFTASPEGRDRAGRISSYAGLGTTLIFTNTGATLSTGQTIHGREMRSTAKRLEEADELRVEFFQQFNDNFHAMVNNAKAKEQSERAPASAPAPAPAPAPAGGEASLIPTDFERLPDPDPRARKVAPLYGYTSEEKSYLVPDYPYGFRKRTEIRYWIEENKKKGRRFVSQTLDPDRRRWNKPKASTYTESPAVMYLDEKGHVVWSQFDSTRGGAEFLSNFFDMPRPLLAEIVAFLSVGKKYYEKQLRLYAQGKSGWFINNEPIPLEEEDITRAQADWRRTAALLDLALRLAPPGTFRNPGKPPPGIRYVPAPSCGCG
jgi:hypothetical protein